jgi:hypothetical protein
MGRVFQIFYWLYDVRMLFLFVYEVCMLFLFVCMMYHIRTYIAYLLLTCAFVYTCMCEHALWRTHVKTTSVVHDKSSSGWREISLFLFCYHPLPLKCSMLVKLSLDPMSPDSRTSEWIWTKGVDEVKCCKPVLAREDHHHLGSYDRLQLIAVVIFCVHIFFRSSSLWRYLLKCLLAR